MKLINFKRAGKSKGSANIARERLQIIVAHERANLSNPGYLSAMQQDIIDVVQKYIEINTQDVSVQLGSDLDISILELNIVLPRKNQHSYYS